MNSGPLRETERGLEIFVRVQPGARRTEIVGLHDNRIKLAVREAAESGRANRGIIRLLAETLNIPLGQIALLRGTTSRNKQLLVVGVSETTAEAALLST